MLINYIPYVAINIKHFLHSIISASYPLPFSFKETNLDRPADRLFNRFISPLSNKKLIHMHIHRATFDPNRGTNISPFLLGVIWPDPANRGAPMIISIGAKLRHPVRHRVCVRVPLSQSADWAPRVSCCRQTARKIESGQVYCVSYTGNTGALLRFSCDTRACVGTEYWRIVRGS